MGWRERVLARGQTWRCESLGLLASRPHSRPRPMCGNVPPPESTPFFTQTRLPYTEDCPLCRRWGAHSKKACRAIAHAESALFGTACPLIRRSPHGCSARTGRAPDAQSRLGLPPPARLEALSPAAFRTDGCTFCCSQPVVPVPARAAGSDACAFAITVWQSSEIRDGGGSGPADQVSGGLLRPAPPSLVRSALLFCWCRCGSASG